MTHANPVARVVNYLTCADDNIEKRITAIFSHWQKLIPGWSRPYHYAFFEAVAMTVPDNGKVLICGCYQGLDLALLTAAIQLTGKNIEVTGVDLFSDEPCADWTDEQKAKVTWEANGYIVPSVERVKQIVPTAKIVKSRAADFMRNTDQKFDFIYLDTAHDYQTVNEEIHAASECLAVNGFIGGDDYTGEPGWGVDRAVAELLPYHVCIFNRVWFAMP